MSKLISHVGAFSNRNVSYPKTFVKDYMVRGSEDVLEYGRILKKSVSKTVHPQDKFKGLKADDFALENVIAVGAFDSLKEGYLNNDRLNVADSAEVSINNIISAVDAAENNLNDGGNE